MWDFEHGTASANFDISYTIPAKCAAALQAGDADIGIIPAAAYATIPDLVILPQVAIAARRAVRSILLLSRVPLSAIRSVALDSSSLTSVALTKVLFAKWFGAGRNFVAMEPNLKAMLAKCDAALLIGDPALQVERSRYQVYDLAEEWIRLTGRPFVFAFWAVRAAALNVSPNLDLSHIFQTSRDHGLQPDNVARIAQTWAPRLGIPVADAQNYLSNDIHYHLDADCLDGLRLFYRYAQECGFLPNAPALRFLEIAKPVAI
jgi:chorismate dehydratase